MKQEDSDRFFLSLGFCMGFLSSDDNREYVAQCIRDGSFNAGYLDAVRIALSDILNRPMKP